MGLIQPLRVAGVAVSAAGLLLAGTAPASADHTHVKKVGNGSCIVIAEGSGESAVELPSAVFAGNPNVDIAEADGLTHPLHVLVHRGVPGDHLELYVMGSPAAIANCPADLLNR